MDNWLLIDTSCPRGIVAVAKTGRLIAEKFLSEQKRHGEMLSDAILECLQNASITVRDLDGVAVGVGPGSFIGTRIAIAQAKGMCSSLEVPLTGLCTLSAIAADEDEFKKNGIVVSDAKKHEMFILQSSSDVVKAVSIAEAQKLTQKSDFIVGYGLELLDTIDDSKRIKKKSSPTGEGLLCVLKKQLSAGKIVDRTSDLTPNYCREPDAKIAGNR